MKHLRYLWYVLRHKWYVFQECARLGIPWAGIVHDWQKFTPAEWSPYVDSFYGPWPYDERPQWLAVAFDRAWLHHQHRGPHHWQYWILREDNGRTTCVQMPERYVKEMVADWYGAGRALGKHPPRGDRYAEVRAWYQRNAFDILLHVKTRQRVEQLIRIGQ